MAKVIRFPGRTGHEDIDTAADLLREIDRTTEAIQRRYGLVRKIEGVCRSMLRALYRNTIRPDKFFIMYAEKGTIAFMSFNYKSAELAAAVDVILQHKAAKTGTSDDPEEPVE